MKRIRIRMKNATLLSGTMTESRAIAICRMMELPLHAVVAIIDA